MHASAVSIYMYMYMYIHVHIHVHEQSCEKEMHAKGNGEEIKMLSIQRVHVGKLSQHPVHVHVEVHTCSCPSLVLRTFAGVHYM